MNRLYAKTLLILFAIMAFIPIFAVDFFLDGYVRLREVSRLQSAVDQIAQETFSDIHEASVTLENVVMSSPTVCTPSFFSNLQGQLQRSLVIRQFVVIDARGDVQCDAFGNSEQFFESLSLPLSVAGHRETLSLGQIDGHDVASIMITREIAMGKTIVAFVPLNQHLSSNMPQQIGEASLLRMTLTDGTVLQIIGDERGFDSARDPTRYIHASSVAGAFPIRSEAATRFSAARVGYSDLDLNFTIIACAISALMLWLALRYHQRSEEPSYHLETAIKQRQLIPFYQPVIDIKTGWLLGCEVLVRWQKPNGEMISPGAFIDYAEMSGLVIPMTISLMEQTRDDLTAIADLPGMLKIGINLAEKHFHDDSIVDDVLEVFEHSKINMQQLNFEVTERRPLENMDRARGVINSLHELGCSVSLDDAGTGNSSFAFIDKLGVDIVKIDKLFVDLIKHESDPVPVLDAIISMAFDMGLQIIAEGIEEEVQVKYLQKKGVRGAQGYLFAKPMPADKYIAMALAMHEAGMIEGSQEFMIEEVEEPKLDSIVIEEGAEQKLDDDFEQAETEVADNTDEVDDAPPLAASA